MKTSNASLSFFLSLFKAQSVLARKFDGRLAGLGLSEFMVLYHLSQGAGEKLRRIDLAEKIGLTASGVTRLLLPMEKVGLIKRESDSSDARVSYVLLAAGGKRALTESLERAEVFAEDILPSGKIKKFDELSSLLAELGGKI